VSFASPVFLWYFMPAILVVYWLLPRGWRNGLVAVVSLIFYTWGAGPYTFLLLSAIVVNFAAGMAIDGERLADRPRGLAVMLGFRLPENFDRPYSAVSITDFWRRWHMSLSRWFRDYVTSRSAATGREPPGRTATCFSPFLYYQF